MSNAVLRSPSLEFDLFELGQTKNRAEYSRLTEYLKNGDIEQNHYFDHRGLFYFHWSYWFQSCSLYSENKKHNMLRLKKIEDAMNELNHQKIWIKNSFSTIESNAQELYEAILKNQINLKDEGVQSLMISTENDLGPYLPFNKMRWINEKYYKLMAYSFLCQKEIKGRDFRMGCHIPVIFHPDQNKFEGHLIYIHQLTPNGVIFKFPNAVIFEKFKSGGNHTIDYNLQEIKDLFTQDFDETIIKLNKLNIDLLNNPKKSKTLPIHSSLLESYSNEQNSMKSNQTDFYLYIDHKQLDSDAASREFSDLLKVFYKYFQLHIQVSVK